MRKKTTGKTLRISRNLDLPLDAVTQKLAWLGRTGSGKTFACKRMVEQMLHAGAQVVILDGAGVWPGLRLGQKRFKIPVFGGLYGDIPIESTGGSLIADVVVDFRTSTVLDVSQMLDAERTRFATAFAQRFFQRKKSEPSAVHLVLEECQEFVPENTQRGEERMLHEFVRISKQGRSFGIGVSFISQRPQEISKKALNQVECVFAFQMTGPHERKALQYWLSDKGMAEKLENILPRLEVGSPHVWSPQWLKISKVVRILPIETLDTSRTPEVGEKAFSQKKLAPIDLKELRTAMAETVERAKLEDPKALLARIAELEKELAKKQPVTKGQKLEAYEVIVDSRHLKEIVDAAEEFEKSCAAFEKPLRELRVTATIAGSSVRRARQTGAAALGKRLAKAPREPLDGSKARVSFGATPPPTPKPKTPHPQSSNAPRANTAGLILPKGERAVLIAVAQHSDGVTRSQLTALTGYKRSSRDAYVSRLSSAGLIDPHANGRIVVTGTGKLELGPDYEPLPTGMALLEHWLKQLPEGERRILEFVAASQPHPIDRAKIDEYTGYKRSSRDAYISRLNARELVIVERDGIRLAESLV